MIEMPGLEKIKYEKDQRDDTIIDAVSQKGIGGRRQEFEMPAEENKRRHMPTHNEHPNRYSDYCKTDGGNISKVFRREVKGIGTKTFHEHSIHYAKKHKPENKQNLVSPEMQEKQLYWEGIIKTAKPGFHGG